jgi:hypothetical protein
MLDDQALSNLNPQQPNRDHLVGPYIVISPRHWHLNQSAGSSKVGSCAVAFDGGATPN